ncbi:hypothetical protein DACRYDRAFT_20611 [Dacryopinax primogenitus]|uniref:Uncharacterized protein n=1 Tax=Dacryopinax primogenitus (strain DJM 731) TaxID=1858805 RepID=M5GG88_DACPD|nr:uncharacterized protein DACRYDRAFT_20611 [Dacryopinax primogenitus]EJU05063.1 hypothetical protein DACRYDRAFT_20611 [Dacryopinax primogenitus]
MNKRLVAIARFLLEQHAQVDFRGKDNATPLSLAYEWGHTDLVKLLLKHGADPTSIVLQAAGTNSRIDELMQIAKRDWTGSATKPPRSCPCFSGKTLAACHQARDHAYPLDFLCPCGKGMSYEDCCLLVASRNWVERWVEEDGYAFIKPVLIERRFSEDSQEVKQISRQLIARLEDLCKEGFIDPSFLSVVRHIKSIPL